MAYSVRSYCDDDEAKVVEIVGSVWGERAVTKFNRLHPWFRRRAEALKFQDDGDVILETDGEVVGYTRVIPCYFLLDGKRIRAGYFADYFTHADHRGSGVQISRHLLRKPDILRVGAPVARTIRMWRKLSGRPAKISQIERCVLMLKPSEFLKRKGLPTPLGWPVDWVWRLKLLRACKSYLRGQDELALSDAKALPGDDELAALVAEFSRDFYAIAERDGDYFRWRFSESGFDYRYVWLRNQGRLVGYAIYRDGEVNGRKTLLIVEIMAIADKQRYYAAMLEWICRYGLANNFADVQTLKSGCADFLQVMQRLGAVLKPENEYLMAYICSDEPYATEMYQDKKWYISLAEADYEFVMYV